VRACRASRHSAKRDQTPSSAAVHGSPGGRLWPTRSPVHRVTMTACDGSYFESVPFWQK
jgi:hypothetical protein